MKIEIDAVIRGYISPEEIEQFMAESAELLDTAGQHFKDYSFERDSDAEYDWFYEYLQDGETDINGEGNVFYPIYIYTDKVPDTKSFHLAMNRLAEPYKSIVDVSIEGVFDTEEVI